MKKSLFTYLLLLVFLSTQTDNVWAAVRCYSRQGETTKTHASICTECCHRGVEPVSCPLQTERGYKEQTTCPLRAEVAKTLEAYEKTEPLTHGDTFAAPAPATPSPDKFQPQKHFQRVAILESPPDLFILQGNLRI